jgi:hypothetical protein
MCTLTQEQRMEKRFKKMRKNTAKSIMGKTDDYSPIWKKAGHFKILSKNNKILNDQPLPNALKNPEKFKNIHELQFIQDFGIPGGVDSQNFRFERSAWGEQLLCIFNQQSGGALTVNEKDPNKVNKKKGQIPMRYAFSQVCPENKLANPAQAFTFLESKEHPGWYNIIHREYRWMLYTHEKDVYPSVFIHPED